MVIHDPLFSDNTRTLSFTVLGWALFGM
jgi:hypothetical protein